MILLIKYEPAGVSVGDGFGLNPMNVSSPFGRASTLPKAKAMPGKLCTAINLISIEF